MAAPDLTAAIEFATCSDPGLVRSNNEDAVLANAKLGLAVLVDGMGGYNAGEVASGMATEALGRQLEQAFAERSPATAIGPGAVWAHEKLRESIVHANAMMHAAAASHAKYAGMGTTLVAAQFYDNRVAVAHVGDSRLYRLRDGTLARLTRDHSPLQEQIDSGMLTIEQARHSPNKNLVTRALGVAASVDVELHEHAVLPGDIYLLCSDGLSDMVPDEEIELCLSSLATNLDLCASQLVQTANDNGGGDNVSVILAKVRQPFPAVPSACGLWARWWSR